MKTIVIVGYGRFGELLADILSSAYHVYICESDARQSERAKSKGYDVVAITEINTFDAVVFAVPISKLDAVVSSCAATISPKQLIMDVCSVKVYPVTIMKKYFPQNNIIATHPMFGPDSASKGLEGLQIALCPVSTSNEQTKEIVDFWTHRGVEVIITTPEDHDKDAVYSQAFTYTLAHIILNTNIPDITLRTKSFDAITTVARLSAKDSDQLFHDMLYYNPYFSLMQEKLLLAIDQTTSRLDAIEKTQRTSTLFRKI